LAEQRQADADRRAQLEAEELVRRLERESLEAERQAVAKARQEADRIEFERQARITAEREAREQAEREQVEALERAARLAALQPDLEKVRLFARAIRGVIALAPSLADHTLAELVDVAVDALEQSARNLEGGHHVV
jgi:multidrug resistance efflux pump